MQQMLAQISCKESLCKTPSSRHTQEGDCCPRLGEYQCKEMPQLIVQSGDRVTNLSAPVSAAEQRDGQVCHNSIRQVFK
jgi:hypothetical protein